MFTPRRFLAEQSLVRLVFFTPQPLSSRAKVGKVGFISPQALSNRAKVDKVNFFYPQALSGRAGREKKDQPLHFEYAGLVGGSRTGLLHSFVPSFKVDHTQTACGTNVATFYSRDAPTSYHLSLTVDEPTKASQHNDKHEHHASHFDQYMKCRYSFATCEARELSLRCISIGGWGCV